MNILSGTILFLDSLGLRVADMNNLKSAGINRDASEKRDIKPKIQRCKKKRRERGEGQRMNDGNNFVKE